MRGLREALLGALSIGALMTFGDWVWASFITAERRRLFAPVPGVGHP